jgi:hypothetical protein
VISYSATVGSSILVLLDQVSSDTYLAEASIRIVAAADTLSYPEQWVWRRLVRLIGEAFGIRQASRS